MTTYNFKNAQVLLPVGSVAAVDIVTHTVTETTIINANILRVNFNERITE